jgi:hypothetical protein
MSENQIQRGFLATKDAISPFILPFQFNPASISDNKGVSYADRGILDFPAKVFTGPGPRTIAFDVKLYGLEEGAGRPSDPRDGGVSATLAKLRSLVQPKVDVFEGTGGVGRRLASPPRCLFGFGRRVLECIVTDLKITETQFNHLLAPVKADVSVTLQVIEEPSNLLYLADRANQRRLVASSFQVDAIVPAIKSPFGG